MPDISLSEAIKVLGISNNYTADDIKKAFRSKAMACHPDKPNGSKVKFQELNDAKEVAEKYLGQPKTNSTKQQEYKMSAFQLRKIRIDLVGALFQAAPLEYNGGYALDYLLQTDLMQKYGTDLIVPIKMFQLDCKLWRISRRNTENTVSTGMLFFILLDFGVMNFVNNAIISGFALVIFGILLIKYSKIKQFMVNHISDKKKPRIETYFK